MADSDLCGRQLGEFVLRERLDEGGFGTVYRCEQPMLDREVVVKVLHRRQRFLREAQLASRLDHPYAAHIYQIGTEPDGTVWIAMELIHGDTLAHWLAQRGAMPLERFVPFFERVAEVAQAAHERGIVHRDLKPSNIMVVERAGVLSPKLLDFGLATLLDDPIAAESPRGAVGRLTPASAAIGSPAYMAPELWDGADAAGSASDLYALGVVAYEALTGGRPFRADAAEDFAVLHRCADPPPTGMPELDRIFRRALAKRASDRYASALDFAAALRAELELRMVARIQVAARQWSERGRAPGMLWRDEVLAELLRWTERSARAGALGAVELAFVEACRDRGEVVAAAARRRARTRRRLGIVAGIAAAAGVVGAFQVRTALRANTAEQVTAATELQAEVEQGRAALLHDELAEAEQHLAEAVRRGDRSPATAFMLARANQPRRAEVARFAARAGRMWSAVWSPDGQRVLVADDAGAQLWDVAERRLIATLDHGASVHDARYTPDGAQIATAGADGTVRLWSARDGVLARTLRPVTGAPHYFLLALSPGLIAAADAAGGRADVWDAATGAELASLRGHGADLPALGFSADGHQLLLGGGDDVQVFETAHWSRVMSIPGPIRRAAWSPATAQIAAGGAAVALWPLAGQPVQLRAAGELLDALAWSGDGAELAIADRTGVVAVYDTATGTLRSQGNQLHNRVFALEVSPGGDRVAAAGATGDVGISDAATGAEVALLEGATALVRMVRFDADGGHVLAASWDGTARIWDAGAPYLRWRSAVVAEDCGYLQSTEPDGMLIPVPCRGHVTRVWDTARDDLIAELPETTAAVVSPLGDSVKIASGEVYQLPGGRLLRREEPLAAPGQLDRPSPDGHWLLTIPDLRSASSPTLRDLRTGTDRPLVGQSIGARWVSATRVLTFGTDAMVRMWDTGGGPPRLFHGGARPVLDAVLSRDGAFLIGGSADGKLRFWSAGTGRPLWITQAHNDAVAGVHLEGEDVVTRSVSGEVARWHIPAR